MKFKNSSLLFILLVSFFISVNYSLSPVPVLAEEQENIDNFNVHPANRWEITSSGMSAEVEDGYLNLTDVGDDTSDYYSMTRDLKTLDSDIEFKFKYISSNGDYSAEPSPSYVYVYIRDKNTPGSYILFVQGLMNNDSSRRYTYLRFTNTDLESQSLGLPTIEDLYHDTWYTVKIKYNLPKDRIEFNCEDIETNEIFDYNYYDISSSDYPSLFSASSIYLEVKVGHSLADQTQSVLFSYIEAPFKYREWKQDTTPSDEDFLYDSFDLGRAQDDIDDYSEWSLVVDRLDNYYLSFTADFEEPTNFDSGDALEYTHTIYNTDKLNGSRMPILTFNLVIYIYEVVSPYIVEFLYIHDGDGALLESQGWDNVPPQEPYFPLIELTLNFRQDRQIINLNSIYNFDRTGLIDESKLVFNAELDIADFTDNPSNEFVLQNRFEFDFDGDMEASINMNDFSFTQKDIFENLVKPIGDIWDTGVDAATGGGNFLSDIFKTLFLWLGDLLGGILEWGFEYIVSALSPLLSAIDDSLGIVSGLLATIDSVLDDIKSGIDNLASNIWGYFEDSFNSMVGYLDDAVEFLSDIFDTLDTLAIGIINYLVAQADPFVDAVVDALVDYSEDIAAIIYDVIDFFWDLLVPQIHGLWRLILVAWDYFWTTILNLSTIDETIVKIIELLQYGVSNLDDYFITFIEVLEYWSMWLVVGWWFYALFLGSASVKFDAIETLDVLIKRIFEGPLVLGFIPLKPGLFIILPLTYFYFIAPYSVWALW